MQMPNANFQVEELVCNESFQQYCLGANLENEILWHDWIDQLPHKREEFEEAKRLVEILSVKQGSRLQQLKELKSGFRQKALLMSSIDLDAKKVAAPAINNGLRPLYKYITSVAALLLVAILIYTNYPSGSLSKVEPQSQSHISSGKQLRKTTVLPDGTVVTLAKESSIQLAGDFNEMSRELRLSGEAFFEVKHDALHPFIVHTAFNDIKVLGTAFNVKAYPDAKEMETSLIRGSLRVDSKMFPGQYVILKPNEKLTARRNELESEATGLKTFEVQPLVVENESQKIEEVRWIKKRMEIDDEPLALIVRKLESWYGIKIIITDEAVKNYHYSGVFENESVVKTLEALQLSFPFNLKIEPDKITISK